MTPPMRAVIGSSSVTQYRQHLSTTAFSTCAVEVRTLRQRVDGAAREAGANLLDGHVARGLVLAIDLLRKLEHLRPCS